MTTKQMLFSAFILGSIANNVLSIDECALSPKEVRKTTKAILNGERIPSILTAERCAKSIKQLERLKQMVLDHELNGEKLDTEEFHKELMKSATTNPEMLVWYGMNKTLWEKEYGSKKFNKLWDANNYFLTNTVDNTPEVRAEAAYWYKCYPRIREINDNQEKYKKCPCDDQECRDKYVQTIGLLKNKIYDAVDRCKI